MASHYNFETMRLYIYRHLFTYYMIVNSGNSLFLFSKTFVFHFLSIDK